MIKYYKKIYIAKIWIFYINKSFFIKNNLLIIVKNDYGLLKENMILYLQVFIFLFLSYQNVRDDTCKKCNLKKLIFFPIQFKYMIIIQFQYISYIFLFCFNKNCFKNKTNKS